MTITPNQWTNTQKLLLLLARALSPTAPLGLPESAALASRIFANFYRPMQTRFTFEAKLLPTLQKASIEIARLIEDFEGESKAIKPPSKITEINNSHQNPNIKDLPKNLGSEPQKLLQQVRIAIGELTSSKYQELPLTTPLSILTKLKPLVDHYIELLAKPNPVGRNPKLTPSDIKPLVSFPTLYPLPLSLPKKKKQKRQFLKDKKEEKEQKD